MRHYHLSRAIVLLASLVAVTCAGTAEGAIEMVAESKSIQSDLTTPLSSFFDVFFNVTGDNPAVAGYQLRLDLVPPDGGVAFSAPISTSATPPMRLPLFPTPPTDLGSTASRIQVTDFLATGANPIANLSGLVRVPFTVAPNTAGMFSLNIHPTETALSDANGSPIAFQIINGTLSVVPIPEPSALLLACAGLAMLALRKGYRRSAVSHRLVISQDKLIVDG
jgi:hypothetical protein